jgi:lipoprotein-anchoring transpeptidase ErfK/SrfK
MPIKGSVGIHDADWRSSFGGEIYKTNGSHGCINTPPKMMAELYEMVEIGTPVISFY